jgi:hypothetical protein
VITVIFAVLGLYVAQTLLPPTIRYLLAGPGTFARLRVALGPRDDPPPLPVLGGRAERVLYVPAYLSGVPGLRSAVWVASWVGLCLMLAAFARQCR